MQYNSILMEVAIMAIEKEYERLGHRIIAHIAGDNMRFEICMKSEEGTWGAMTVYWRKKYSSFEEVDGEIPFDGLVELSGPSLHADTEEEITEYLTMLKLANGLFLDLHNVASPWHKERERQDQAEQIQRREENIAREQKEAEEQKAREEEARQLRRIKESPLKLKDNPAKVLGAILSALPEGRAVVDEAEVIRPDSINSMGYHLGALGKADLIYRVDIGWGRRKRKVIHLTDTTIQALGIEVKKEEE